MSEWYPVDKDDLELDGDEINVYVTSNSSGSIYVTIKISDMQELLNDQEGE